MTEKENMAQVGGKEKREKRNKRREKKERERKRKKKERPAEGRALNFTIYTFFRFLFHTSEVQSGRML